MDKNTPQIIDFQKEQKINKIIEILRTSSFEWVSQLLEVLEERQSRRLILDKFHPGA